MASEAEAIQDTPENFPKDFEWTGFERQDNHGKKFGVKDPETNQYRWFRRDEHGDWKRGMLIRGLGFQKLIDRSEAALVDQRTKQAPPITLVAPSTPVHGSITIPFLGQDVTPPVGKKAKPHRAAAIPLFLDPRDSTPALPPVQEEESDTTLSGTTSDVSSLNISDVPGSLNAPLPKVSAKSMVHDLQAKMASRRKARTANTLHGIKGRRGSVDEIKSRKDRSRKAANVIIEERAKALAAKPRDAPRLQKKSGPSWSERMEERRILPTSFVSKTEDQPPSRDTTEDELDEKARETDPSLEFSVGFGGAARASWPDISEASSRASISATVRGKRFIPSNPFARQQLSSKTWKRRENEIARLRWRRMMGWGSDWGPTKKHIIYK